MVWGKEERKKEGGEKEKGKLIFPLFGLKGKYRDIFLAKLGGNRAETDSAHKEAPAAMYKMWLLGNDKKNSVFLFFKIIL